MTNGCGLFAVPSEGTACDAGKAGGWLTSGLSVDGGHMRFVLFDLRQNSFLVLNIPILSNCQARFSSVPSHYATVGPKGCPLSKVACDTVQLCVRGLRCPGRYATTCMLGKASQYHCVFQRCRWMDRLSTAPVIQRGWMIAVSWS